MNTEVELFFINFISFFFVCLFYAHFYFLVVLVCSFAMLFCYFFMLPLHVVFVWYIYEISWVEPFYIRNILLWHKARSTKRTYDSICVMYLTLCVYFDSTIPPYTFLHDSIHAVCCFFYYFALLCLLHFVCSSTSMHHTFRALYLFNAL